LLDAIQPRRRHPRERLANALNSPTRTQP
jgi:hypothetical protein